MLTNLRRPAALLLTGLATSLSLTMVPPAAAEPGGRIWICHGDTPSTPKGYELNGNERIYGCPWGYIDVKDTYANKIVRRLSGSCAHDYWTRGGRSQTWVFNNCDD